MLGQGKGAGGSTLSLSAAEAAKAVPTEHKMGDYDGTEKFAQVPPSFTSKVPNTPYCLVYDAWLNQGWCSKVPNPSNNWRTTHTGTFNPGSFTSTMGAAHINMMPYAAVSYIIKT
jgi:hypothetical protein